MTGKLVIENFKHKPMRSLLSILLIGVPVTLILCLVGLSHGMIADSQQRARGSGADIMVRGSNAKAMLSQSSATLPEEFIAFFEKQPHVALAMGLVSHAIELPLFVNGVDLDRFTKMSGGFNYLEGGPFQGPNDVIIDRFYAEQRKKHAGDTLELLNRPGTSAASSKAANLPTFWFRSKPSRSWIRSARSTVRSCSNSTIPPIPTRLSRTFRRSFPTTRSSRWTK